MHARRAERTTDKIAGQHDTERLVAAIGARDRQFERAFEHVADKERLVALPYKRLPLLDDLMPPQPIELFQAFLGQGMADRLVANSALRTGVHGLSARWSVGARFLSAAPGRRH